MRERTHKAGELILLEGEHCEGLYFVVRGRVKVFKVCGEGKEQVLRILGPGRTFNDVPVFDGEPNPGSIEALEASTIGMVPRATVLALVEKDGAIRLERARVVVLDHTVLERWSEFSRSPRA